MSSMLRHFVQLFGIVVALAPAQFAAAHGTPVLVGQSANTLVASGGLGDSSGFVSQIFVEDDEDGDPFATLTLPNVGPVIVWQIPGFDIAGLDNQSSLSIEVLARPVKDSNPLEKRILWFWNPTSEEVEPAGSALHLLGTGQRFTTLLPTEDEAPPPFLMAQTLQGQQGFHNHGLLSYALDNDPPPAAGAYGFFARLTSNQYSPSNPFSVFDRAQSRRGLRTHGGCGAGNQRRCNRFNVTRRFQPGWRCRRGRLRGVAENDHDSARVRSLARQFR
jgi:hypothetical protein